MKNRLILYPGHFSPITRSEILYADWWNRFLHGKVLFLPYKEDKNASFSNRFDMLRVSIDGNIDKARVSDTLLTKTLIDCIKNESSYEIYVLEDLDNNDLIAEILKKGFPNERICKPKAKESSGNCFIFLSKEEDNRNLKTIDLCKETITYIHQEKLFYIDKVASFLSEKRLAHSESVASLCYTIAESNQMDNPGRAYIAGLLHDIGKYASIEEAGSLMKGEYDKFIGYPKWAYHQFVGAILAKRDFAINDEEILNAICYHCTGKPAMNPLGEILYSADKIDPLRGWDSRHYIQECKSNYHKGFLEVLDANRLYLQEKTKGQESECPMSEECYKFYLG